ncbi:flagellar assembly protein FliH [Hydrogenimonas sp.]
METVIPPEKIKGHVIQKYHFKVLASGTAKESPEETNPSSESDESCEIPPEISSDRKEDTHHEEVVEQMLKKADELSSNLVKMQMQLEKQQEEFEKRLEEAKRKAFEEGQKAGEEACKARMQEEIDTLKERLAASIAALEESRNQFEKKIDTIEEELIETALDLARQVVAKEIDKDSKEVALRLARLLLTEVKEATKITLKVNPQDYDYIKDRLVSSDNLQIVSDPAIGPGGVLILSDVGNIDGEIMHRFERIKEAVFGTAVKQ